MNPWQAVARLGDMLNRMGSRWEYRVSDPTNSPSSHISERYAVLWKPSKVKLIGRPRLLSEFSRMIDREPYLTTFEIEGTEVSILNFHARPHNKAPELELAVIINGVLQSGSNHWIIAGDFNLSEDHDVLEPLYDMGYKSAIQNQPTTLKRACEEGEYLNYAIDNIYYNANMMRAVKSGTIDHVPDCSGLSFARGVSDHLGVYLTVRPHSVDE